MSVKIVLADDHPIVRQGLRWVLDAEPDFEVIAETGDGLEAIQLAEQKKPDILIVDLMMPGLSGLEVTRQVVNRRPDTRVVVLSMHQDDEYVLQALRGGAMGFVIKDSDPDELVKAVRDAIRGRRYLSSKLSDRLIDLAVRRSAEEAIRDPYEQLTDREREVLQLVAEGHTNAEIGKRLSISTRTAEAHRANLMRKLSANTQADLIRLAIKKGLLSLDG